MSLRNVKPHLIEDLYDEYMDVLQAVRTILGVDNLLTLHKINNTGFNDNPGHDQKTVWHQIFYEAATSATLTGDSFARSYDRLVEKVYSNVLDTAEFYDYVQAVPTFRVQYPGSKSVGGIMHRDGDYGHPAGELNIIFPITDMTDGCTLFTESAPDLGDFRVYPIPCGKAFVFRGQNCRHGNLESTAAHTRLSIDFRFITRENLKRADKSATTVGTKMRFKVGEYYKRLP